MTCIDGATERRTFPGGLAKKIAEAITEIKQVGKEGHNDFHNYDYVTESDVLKAAREPLARRGVIVVPRLVSFAETELKAREGKDPMKLGTAHLSILLVDGETGEQYAVDWQGTGADTADKGLYKALTGGLKTFLMKLLLIPSADDPEGDSDTDRNTSSDSDTDRNTSSRQERAPQPRATAGRVHVDADGKPKEPEAGFSREDPALLGLWIEFRARQIQHETGEDWQDVVWESSGWEDEKTHARAVGRDGKPFGFRDPHRAGKDPVKWLRWLNKTYDSINRRVQILEGGEVPF